MAHIDYTLEFFLEDMKEAIDLLRDVKVNTERQYHSLYRSYKTSVGWTTKYRNALAEANKKLIDAGLEPVKVIGGASFMDVFDMDEEGQLTFKEVE